MPRTDLPWALAQFRNTTRRTNYQLACAYYDGEHRVGYDARRFKSIFAGMFATVRANICQVVVDSLTDRLEIIGFEAGSDTVGQRLQELWDSNLMDLVANEVHREAFKTGDAYVIVQPDEHGEPRFWFNPAEQVVVAYSDTNPGVIVRAAKLWFAELERVWRLNLYYEDRIEKYVAERKRDDILAGDINESYWLPYPYTADAVDTDAITPWSYGQVPVFHFSNKNLYRYGYSELAEVIPLQDAVNKTISDLLVTSEFSSFKQRYVTGVETEELEGEAGQRLMAGVDRIMAVTSETARFGEFSASDLKQFLDVVDHFMRQVARISGIPLHFIYEVSGDFPSGDALKTAEARFTKKLADKQVAFGNVWEQVLKFALALDGESADDIDLVWADTAPRTQKELMEELLMKRVLGVPNEQLFLEAGYTDDQAEAWAEELAANPPAVVDPPSVTGSAQASVRAAEAVMATPTGRVQVNGTSYGS